MGFAQVNYPGSLLPCGESIAAVGCKVTTYADIRTWSGKWTDPPAMAAALVAAGEMSGCLIRHGDSLERAFPGEFELAGVWSFAGPADLSLADNQPADRYVELWIMWPNGLVTDNPHYLPVYNYKAGDPPSSLQVVDSYDGAIKPLSNYGDPATIICGVYWHRQLAPAPGPAPGPTHVPVSFPSEASGLAESSGTARLAAVLAAGSRGGSASGGSAGATVVESAPPSPPGGWSAFRAWLRALLDWLLGRG